MIRGQAGSALSVRAWCEKRDLREATFYWWRTELARRDAKEPTFLPVQVTRDEPANSGGRIEIVRAGWRSACHGERVRGPSDAGGRAGPADFGELSRAGLRL